MVLGGAELQRTDSAHLMGMSCCGVLTMGVLRVFVLVRGEGTCDD